MKYTHVIWDFNGTLMNDVDAAVSSVNDMLLKRGMALTNKDEYRCMMTSPIIDYYKKIFDLSIVPFENITHEFLEGYNKYAPLSGLSAGAREALDSFKRMGLRQCLISSFEQGRLEVLTERLGIRGYFSEISGADNIRAENKLDRGVAWLIRSGAQPSKVLVIGDLVHDWEMAQSLGAECFLIAAGHQCRESLESCGAPVFNSINQMMESLLNE